VRSEKIVEFSSDDNFIEIVGDNFEKIVLDPRKDVLVIRIL